MLWFWSDPLRTLVKQVGERVASPSTLSLWALLSVILGLTGPFGTYDAMDTLPRLLFWSGVISLSIVIALALNVIADQFLASLRPALRAATQIVAFATILTPLLLWIGGRVAGPALASTMSRGETFVAVLATAMSVTVIRNVLYPGEAEAEAPPAPRPLAPGPDPVAAAPRLIARLPADLQTRAVQRLSVRDHYVEVYLADGAMHRLLMRFADAVAEMEGVDGFCTHRSHWVARAAVAEARRVKGRDELILTDGTRIPVSRTYRPNVVQAGFLEPG